ERRLQPGDTSLAVAPRRAVFDRLCGHAPEQARILRLRAGAAPLLAHARRRALDADARDHVLLVDRVVRVLLDIEPQAGRHRQDAGVAPHGVALRLQGVEEDLREALGGARVGGARRILIDLEL